MAEELRVIALAFLRSSSCMDLADRLGLLHYFHDAFVGLGDVESQLVLRYEILLLRDKYYRFEGFDLHSWISFADDCLESGYVNNAMKAYERVATYFESCQDVEEQEGSHLRRTWTLKLQAMKNVPAETAPQKDYGDMSRSPNKICIHDNVSRLQHDFPKTVTSRYMAGIKVKEQAKLQTSYTKSIRNSFSLSE